MTGHRDQHVQSPSPARLEMLGEVLAAAGYMLAAWAQRHRGGPGAIRRAVSIAIALMIAIIPAPLRDIAAIVRRCSQRLDHLRRHMAQPPSCWSAP